MTASVRAGIITPRDTGLKWPVVCWKSPSVHNTAPELKYVPSPIPPHAFVDYAMECLVADVGYVKGDLARGQRLRLVGANDFIHPLWDASNRSMALTSGNATNAYYLSNKSTVVAAALVNGSWNQRLYGAWPLQDVAGIVPDFTSSRRNLLTNPAKRILRRVYSTPWEIIKTAPQLFSYETKSVGGGDEPMFIQLWGRCVSPENGYQVGDEVIFNGMDGGVANAGGEVWYNKSVVGFGVNVGHGMLSFDGSAIVTATPAKWLYQLRMAFATDADGDTISPRNGSAMSIVSMYYGAWQQMQAGKARGRWQLPANYYPVDIGISLRCIQNPDGTGGWDANDQIYSRNSGQASNALAPVIVVRGREVIIPAYKTVANDKAVGKTGVGAATTLSPKIEIQIRAIGT